MLREAKFTMPKFSGVIYPNDYISWALKVDKIFQVYNFDEPKNISMSSLELDDYTLIWWKQTQELRQKQGEAPLLLAMNHESEICAQALCS